MHLTPFKHHIDNAQEIISARHINAIQEAVNSVEQRVIHLSSEQFKSEAFFLLEHSRFANALFLDDFTTPYKIFNAQSQNILYLQDEQCVTLQKDQTVREGEMLTVKLSSTEGTVIDTFQLIAEAIIPSGCALHFFISIDGHSYYPIKANKSEPTKLSYKGNTIYLKAVFYKNHQNESPSLYGWSLLFHDPLISKPYDLSHIELDRLDTTTIGETILIRDPDNDDQLRVVITPNSMTELHYEMANNESRLAYILERSEDKIVKQTMHYGYYENAQGVQEEVLLSLTTSLENPVEVGE